jgi:hypothetical protein
VDQQVLKNILAAWPRLRELHGYEDELIVVDMEIPDA